MKQSSEVVVLADRPSLVAGEETGRAAAFTRLADEHLDRAYRLARAILRDPAEAQDATHDAFVQAWRKWDTLRDPARFEPWFDRILVNTCRDRLRGPSRQTTDISAEVAYDPKTGTFRQTGSGRCRRTCIPARYGSSSRRSRNGSFGTRKRRRACGMAHVPPKAAARVPPARRAP